MTSLYSKDLQFGEEKRDVRYEQEIRRKDNAMTTDTK